MWAITVTKQLDVVNARVVGMPVVVHDLQVQEVGRSDGTAACFVAHEYLGGEWV